MHSYKLLLVLTLLLTPQNADESVDNLRQRVYLMEQLFRNDIDAVRQIIHTETNERKRFMESVTAFMQVVNITILSNSRALRSDFTLIDSDVLANTRLQIVSMGTAISSLKRIYKQTNKTVEHFLDQIQGVTESLHDMKKTLSEVDDTCKAIYAFLCSCGGWQRKDIQCYKLFHAKKFWSDAKAHCQELGGDLAVVEDRTTNDFVAAGMSWANYYLDGTDSGHEGRWIWNSTGEEIQFNNWQDEQPDNYHGDEHCLVLRDDYLWNDVPCHMKFPYVCQRSCSLI